MTSSSYSTVGPQLRERVLERLGFASPPPATLQGLTELYSAWCPRVPFDNVRKLIHVRAGEAGPLPGSSATDFFEAWLKHGTGGTCWAGSNALFSLLSSLGFDVIRGIGTMLAAPNIPPNHGTVIARFDSERYLVDTAILHGKPLPLVEQDLVEIAHPAWGIRCSRLEGKWHIEWRALHKVDGFICRLESFGHRDEEIFERHEQTRAWSPFNYQVCARGNRGDRALGLAFGRAVTLESDGAVTSHEIDHQERVRILVEDLGFSEEIASKMPVDIPTPPPPGSATAQARTE
jgi:arylamine N-acetyltransferase